MARRHASLDPPNSHSLRKPLQKLPHGGGSPHHRRSNAVAVDRVNCALVPWQALLHVRAMFDGSKNGAKEHIQKKNTKQKTTSPTVVYCGAGIWCAGSRSWPVFLDLLLHQNLRSSSSCMTNRRGSQFQVPRLPDFQEPKEIINEDTPAPIQLSTGHSTCADFVNKPFPAQLCYLEAPSPTQNFHATVGLGVVCLEDDPLGLNPCGPGRWRARRRASPEP